MSHIPKQDFNGVFSHQRPDVYKTALPFARWVYAQVPRFSPGRAALKDRLLRAAESTVLNITEGARQESPKMAKKHCRIALASAAECAAAPGREISSPEYQSSSPGRQVSA